MRRVDGEVRADAPGIEPGPAKSKSAVLPLHHVSSAALSVGGRPFRLPGGAGVKAFPADHRRVVRLSLTRQGSNLDSRNQNPPCCLYTTRHRSPGAVCA